MGIGESIARAFAEENAEVLIVDLVEPENMPFATFLKCDCGVPEEIESCCKKVASVDILINNVCVQLEAPCHEQRLEDWNRTVAVGLTSYFLFSKYLLPPMIEEKKGVIINIASVQGSQSEPGIPAYAAVKGGVLSLTRQLAVEYAALGIRVNSVSPGPSFWQIIRQTQPTNVDMKCLGPNFCGLKIIVQTRQFIVLEVGLEEFRIIFLQ